MHVWPCYASQGQTLFIETESLASPFLMSIYTNTKQY